MAERVQLRRTKGYRKPEGAVVVARPSRWGNPWPIAGDWIMWTAVGLGYHGRLRQLRASAQELSRRVQEALANAKVLSGLLPICAWCKKVREDSGYWSQIEEYISERTAAEFSHGICPECRSKHFPHWTPVQSGQGTPPGVADV